MPAEGINVNTNEPRSGFAQESATSGLYNNTEPDMTDNVDHGGDPKSGESNQPSPG